MPSVCRKTLFSPSLTRAGQSRRNRHLPQDSSAPLSRPSAGFLPVEGSGRDADLTPSLCRVPLCRGKKPMLWNYCLFRKRNHSGFYIEEFADILKRKFVESRCKKKSCPLYRKATFSYKKN